MAANNDEKESMESYECLRPGDTRKKVSLKINMAKKDKMIFKLIKKNESLFVSIGRTHRWGFLGEFFSWVFPKFISNFV